VSAALEVREVTRRFGPQLAADRVSFEVERGRIVGFIGPNGAGKTTTMRICATLDLPDRGDVLVGGESVLVEPRNVRRRLGFMPDAYGAYSNTTVADYLDFFARAYELRGAARLAALKSVTEFTALDGLLEKPTSALSKGMKQRLCLAKTLLHDPEVLILDEPAAGLDPRARVELRELVKVLAQQGKAILISSHILTELSEMCDGVVVIERGRIRASGTVEQITRDLKPHLQIRVRALAPAADLERLLNEQPGVSEVRAQKGGFVFSLAGDDAAVARLLAALVGRGLDVVEFAPETVNLEDVFLELTEGKVQ
jgi:ABC-2 type transport system ATP-binding protein